MRYATSVGVFTVVAFAACVDASIVPPGTETPDSETASTVLRIAVPVELGARGAAAATISGPVTQSLELAQTNIGFEGSFEKIPSGTYTVAVQVMQEGEVDQFGRTSGVRVVAGDTANTTVDVRSFVPILGEYSSPSTSTTLVVSYSAVPFATGYVVEVDSSAEFRTAVPLATSDTSTVLFATALGSVYIRVRATNDLVEQGRASEVRSIHVVSDLTPSGDDAYTAPDVGIGAAANGTYGQLNILPVADEDWFAINLSAGDALTVEVRSSSLNPRSALNPVLALLDEANGLIAENDDAHDATLESRLEAVVGADGTYFLRVAGSNGTGVGHYELDVVVVEAGAVGISFEVIEEVHTGLLTNIRERRRSVISTDTDWEQFWNELQGAVVPRPDAPIIDFAERMVIVAAMGQRMTAGFNIEVEDVFETDGTLTVRVAKTSPSPTCAVAQVVTAPVTAVVVPRTDGSVVFLEETRMRDCGADGT